MTTIPRMRGLAASALLAAGAALWAVQAGAASRVALVVGNGGYDPANIARLDNPVNDARLMAGALERVGFEVSLVTDAGQDAMRRAIKAFGKRLRGAGAAAVGLFYYAGHGVEADGSNYLIPIGAEVESAMDLQSDAVPAQWVLSRMEAAGNRLNMVILDACRNNPYAGRVRGGARGLARMDAPSGSLIAYSAAPGQVAADGEGENSPYTAALAEALAEPGMKVEEVFKRVRVRVEDETGRTGRKQTPWESSSLRGDFYFVPPRPAGDGAKPAAGDGAALSTAPAAATAPGAAGPTEDRLAERAYEAAERVDTVAAFEAVVGRFPESIYADLARAQIGKLTAAAVETVASAPSTSAFKDMAAAAPAPAEVESSLGLDRKTRRMIQRGLVSLGFSPGPADGAFGPRTRAAIRRYQGETEFEATGYLSAQESKALAALGEAATRAKAEAERLEAQRRAEAERKRTEKKARLERKRRERERALREPGRRFRDCDGQWCPELVVVPAGSYTMGSPESEESLADNERPQHRVRIAKPFAVGVYEVTRGEWRRFVEATGHSTGNSCLVYESWEWKERSGRDWRNPGYAQTDGHPAACVSWEDAKAYVRWLSRETGERYRLLSESEWEYVARAGTRTPFHFGATISTEQANYDGNYTNGSGRKGRSRERTVTVGSFPPNGFGLHDVHGNVWEWVEDCWHDSYAGAPGDGSAWTDDGYCSFRELRGGSWLTDPSHLRSAARFEFTAGSRLFAAGFRVARTLD